jgi:hypothetical protein
MNAVSNITMRPIRWSRPNCGVIGIEKNSHFTFWHRPMNDRRGPCDQHNDSGRCFISISLALIPFLKKWQKNIFRIVRFEIGEPMEVTG